MATCVFCQAIKQILDDLEISFQFLRADELPEKEKIRVIKEFKQVNSKCSFPTVVVDEVIVGYKIQEIKETIDIHTAVDDLYDKLKNVNESKGYYLNGDKEETFELLRSLLTSVCPEVTFVLNRGAR